jgi:hypothetical protein
MIKILIQLTTGQEKVFIITLITFKIQTYNISIIIRAIDSNLGYIIQDQRGE